MVGDKKNIWCNPQNAGKRHPGREIFQSMTFYKSPLRNVFFFFDYHKLGWDME